MISLFNQYPIEDKGEFTYKELDKLYLRFKHLDKQNRDSLTFKEFQTLPELAVNPLADRIIKVMFKDQANLNFNQFVNMLAPFAQNAKREAKLKCMLH